MSIFIFTGLIPYESAAQIWTENDYGGITCGDLPTGNNNKHYQLQSDEIRLEEVQIKITDGYQATKIQLFDYLNRKIELPFIQNGNKLYFNSSALPDGRYTVSVFSDKKMLTYSYIKRN